MPHDLVIKNGTVVDGSGSPRFRADVGVRGGKIAEVGDLEGQLAGRTLDAEGLVLSPGFFDMHTHYDAQLCWDPLATSSSWHGITTVLTGNCGYGIAPAKPEDRPYLANLMAYVEGIQLDVLEAGLDWEWHSFGDFLRRLERKTLGVNVAAQVGHSALRYYTMGPASYEREATGGEIAAMKQCLRQAMLDGAIGFSTLQAVGRIGAYGKPVPSDLASLEELYELGDVLGGIRAGMITIAPRPGSSRISPDYREFLMDWNRRIRRPVIWTQFHQRPDVPHAWKDLLAWMDEAMSQGHEIYTVASCTRLDREFNLKGTAMFDYFPLWKTMMQTPLEEKKHLLADPEFRARLREQFDGNAAELGRRQESLIVKDARLGKNKSLEGTRVMDLAASQAKDFLDAFFDLALDEGLETQFMYVGVLNGDPEAVGQIISSPYALPGASDAGAHLDAECNVDFTATLLGHWVREKGVMTLEEAVRRLTSMSAGVLGITDRGLVKEDLAADIVLFDPQKVRALPREVWRDLPGGGERIVMRAEGIEAVIVNGEPLFEAGEHTGAMPGKILATPAAVAVA